MGITETTDHLTSLLTIVTIFVCLLPSVCIETYTNCCWDISIFGHAYCYLLVELD